MRIDPARVPSSFTPSVPPPALSSSAAASTAASSTEPAATFERNGDAPWRAFAAPASLPQVEARAADEGASATDDVVEKVFQELLGRSAGAAGFWQEHAAQKQAEGMPLDQIEAELRGHVKASEEYRALHATDAIVDDAFLEVMGRDSGGAGFWHDFAKQKQAEGMPLDAIDREVRAHLQASDEYRSSRPTGTAEDAFIRQPNGWTCAPTSLAMALAHHGLGSADPQTAQRLAAETGTNPSVGFPGGVSLMASEARARGLQATSSSSRSVGDMRSEVEQGRALIVNGTHPSGVPHFLYVAGVAADGRFIVNDPASGGTQRWSDAQLHEFTHRGSNPPGYAAVWT